MPTPRKPVPKPEEVYGNEHAKLVAEVLEDQERKRKEEADRSARDRKRRSEAPFFAQVGLLVTASFSAYLFFFSPSWVVVAQTEPPPAERLDASARVAAYVYVELIRDFEREEGRIPRDLSELASFTGRATDPGIEYERVGPDTYRVTANSMGQQAVYTSTQDLEAFVGDARPQSFGG